MVRWIVAVVVVLAVAYVGLMVGASELAEEVVVLRTFDAQGAAHETSLWIVEDADGALWLRAGMPSSSWLERLRARPDVELVRAGTTALYTATPVPEERERIHALTRERYGIADRIISALRDGSQSVPVRLDPRQA